MELPLRELTDTVLGDARPSQPFGMYVFGASDLGAELGRELERQVFLEYFGNSRELMAQEYDPYDPSSLFLCVIDHRRITPAGVMRMMVPSPAGQKTFVDVERVWHRSPADLFGETPAASELHRVWDISTLAVAADYRGKGTEGLISLALYQGMFQTALPFDVGWFFMALDVVVLDLIETRMHGPFSYFPGLEPKSYLDSPATLPVYLDIERYRAHIHELDATVHALLYDGIGLQEAIAPAPWRASVGRALATIPT
jgi:Acetyltransferase (GNAT) domain